MTTTAARAVYTAADLAERLGAGLRGNGDLQITGIDSLAEAGAEDITFIADTAHQRRWPDARAGAALVSAHLDGPEMDVVGRAVLVVPDAELALATLLSLFAPPPGRPEPGVHVSAVVDPTAVLDPEAAVGPLVTIGPGTEIAAGVVLHAGVRIGAEVRIGEGTELHANVVVGDRCQIGRRVILHSGVVVGADGFGYRADPSGRGSSRCPTSVPCASRTTSRSGQTAASIAASSGPR